jgi:hypothetical protein
MFLHQVIFLPRQLSLLEQHAIRNGDLADVVKKRAPIERVEVRLIELQLTAERSRVVGQAIAVAFRARIARLDDASKREKERFGRFEVVGEARGRISDRTRVRSSSASTGLFRKSSAPASRPARRV